ARIADVFMKAQSSSAIATAHTLIGSRNVHRISPDMSDSHFTLDGIQHMPLLASLGRDEALRRLPELYADFFTAKAPPFVPCHRLGDIGLLGAAPRERLAPETTMASVAA
ncbi:MAG TPA: hypothetical protein VHT04_04230, partial [Stellaceae bacterium]|nr:hypothetical protein [Stellaceae bacterium]